MELGFRGDRDYLHGTDIYNVLLHELEAAGCGRPAGPVSLSFRRFAKRQLDAVICEEGDAEVRPADTAVFFAVETDAGPVHGWMSESERPVTDRRPFDESVVCDATRITAQAATVEAKLELTPIEVAIPMTKHLHQALLPAGGRRWILSRLDLARPFRSSDVPGLTIELVQNLNQRLTKSAMSGRAGRLGHIYFTLVGS